MEELNNENEELKNKLLLLEKENQELREHLKNIQMVTIINDIMKKIKKR